MINREIIEYIKLTSAKMPVISITGPRQSGKTTLAKMCFPHYDYVNLENPDVLEEAKSDPRLFLTRFRTGLILDEIQLFGNERKGSCCFRTGLILDEIQRFPELFSYVQTISDEHNRTGEFILTGSQNFLLSAKISQSLAGRVFVAHLLPFSISELKSADFPMEDYADYILKGFYPRIYDKDIEPNLFYPSYIQTYTERDLRQIVNVSNSFLFQKFMRLAAGRIGQLLNYNNIASELGVDLKTVKSWFSILETSFIIFFLQPHHQNFSKRLIKTPKLYFYDTGLVCSLLGIREKEDLESHWAKGSLFENMIIADLMKNYWNCVKIPPLYFWRDNTGNEIDCLIDETNKIKSVEIKSSTTISADFFKGLKFYKNLNETTIPFLIYGGEENKIRKEAKIVAWNNSKTL
ncbi:MAG: ATP-binding protein [Planctomycetaceae bacterium]|jgi:predicted AAA+ superfamily ATPase|nr:ATP-binding protein [Planctomycetaceae bacterium]